MHYTWQMIQDLATEPDSTGMQLAEIRLAEGDRATNPASTSRDLYGPSVVRYEIHPSGISTIEFHETEGCLAVSPQNEWPYTKKCGAAPVEHTTRCADHQLVPAEKSTCDAQIAATKTGKRLRLCGAPAIAGSNRCPAHPVGVSKMPSEV